MHQKFKMKVLSNSKLNLDIQHDVCAQFFFVEVQWTVIPNVKWWKFIDVNEKMIMVDFLFLNPPPALSILRFLAKWSYDILRDLLTQYLYFEMLTTINSFVSQFNFDSAL